MGGDDERKEWWTVMERNPHLILIVSVKTPKTLNNSFEIHSTHTSEDGIIAS